MVRHHSGFPFVRLLVYHAEDTEEGVADGAEGLGILLVSLTDLELDLLDGRGVPV
jgi:hypothetical protein